MIVLYEHPLSPYAQKVKTALREKGLPFTTTLPNAIGTGLRASGSTPDQRFRAASPRAEVPVLLDDDLQLFDSTIILEYLEDRYPTPPLMPGDPARRAAARTIEEVMDTHYEAINWGLSEIRYFGRAQGALRERLEAAAAQQTRGLQSWLEHQLAAAPWFGGEVFGWADLSVVPYLNGSLGFGLGPRAGSPLSHWLERANQRPSVAAARAEAAASLSAMQNVSELVERGLFKRQYRDHRLEWMIKSGGLEVVAEGLRRNNIRFTEFPASSANDAYHLLR